MLKQKLMGLALILMSLIPIWLENDGTIAVMFIPLGIYMIFTKKYLLD